MVLGPLLFSLGTIAALRRLQAELPHASFVAYLDDVTVAAAPEHLEAACGAAAQAMEELGIKNNAAKMEVLDPTCLSGFGDARRLTCARVLARLWSAMRRTRRR
ncbi:hypothetical protein ERJ75_000623100 [Trypanosoma vivax]|nr:hypothetical protein ERJ75_000623100 [Trypanosoma vivax]